MKYIYTLAFEILTIALVTALALSIAVKVNGPIITTSQAIVTGLCIGAIVHIAFELSGGNAYYCSHGAACTTSDWQKK